MTITPEQIEMCREQFSQHVRGRTPTEALPVGVIHELCDAASRTAEAQSMLESEHDAHMECHAREQKMREKLADIRACFLGIDQQAQRLLGPPSTNWYDKEVIVGYKLNTGLWHRLHGLLADVEEALK